MTGSINGAARSATVSERWRLRLATPERDAVARLRLAAAVSLLAELILPIFEATSFARPDWLAILAQLIWFVCTLILLAATWHPRFVRIWKPAVLLFSTALICSSGFLAVRGASMAPFLFLLVLLPVGGTCLPWDNGWQAGMSAICIVLGLAFASQLGRQSGLLISGLSAMVASILGSHLLSAALTRQRVSIASYLKALARSEAKFRKIFETSGSIITIYSIPDGRIVDVNPAWEKTFGCARAEALGKCPGELGLVSERDEFLRWVGALKMGDAGMNQKPVVFTNRNRDSVFCLFSWSTLELNEQDCVLVVGQDVTARVLAQEELARSRETMLNQERLKAVGELASGMAHDLNNSLNALRLNIELMHDEQSPGAEYHEQLDLLSRIVGDASSTIGRLQDFARRRHDRPAERIDLGAIIRQSVEMARSTLVEKNSMSGRSTHVEVNLPSLPEVLGEPSELRQIFLNLLFNAQDAMPRGGAIRIGGDVSRNMAVITIEDEGEGIPEQYLGRVFDPFFTTKGERGTGLGLSIAYGAMARLGGGITAANRSIGGAIFTLSFPLAPAAAVHPVEPIACEIQPLRVMVIDDDPDNLEALRALFESKGHTVKVASSGTGALEELMDEESNVDVVFCDLGMPVVSGLDVARQIKSLARPPLFYLVTGWAQEIGADDPCRDLVDAVVAKPVEPHLLDELLAGVQSHPQA